MASSKTQIEENMETLLLALGTLLFAASTWFVLAYAKRKTPCFIILLSIASIGLGSAAVALLPIDLSYASRAKAANVTSHEGETDDDYIYSYSNNPTYIPWKVTYWTTFFLAWIILPITRQSLTSGQFTRYQRIKDGVSRSIKGIVLMMIAGVVTVIVSAVKLRTWHIVTIVMPALMALGNTYGLVLVALLLGNGLVNIPKRFWREACPSSVLRRSRIIASHIEESLFESVMQLEDIEDKIEEVCAMAVQLDEGGDEGLMRNEDGELTLRGQSKRATRCSCCGVDEVTEFHGCLEVLVRRKNETINLCAERRTRRNDSPTRGHHHRRRASRDDDGDTPEEVNTMDINYLLSLSSKLMDAQENVNSAQLRWDTLMEHSRLFSALMDGEVATTGGAVGDRRQGSDGSNENLLSPSSNHGSCGKVCYMLRRVWVRYLRFPTYRVVAMITAVLSVFVLMSEVTLGSKMNLSPFSWLVHGIEKTDQSSHQIPFQIAALVPLLYMSLSLYSSLFQIFGSYSLRGNRQSHGVALLFNAQYLVRLQFPLGYNYLLMLKYDLSHCAFGAIMDDMSTIPFLGASFSVYAPLLILAVCLFTLCDVYPRLLKFLGIEHEDALLVGDADELAQKENDGIQLMKRHSKSARGGSSSPEKQRLNRTIV